jgi:hypothetical protein
VTEWNGPERVSFTLTGLNEPVEGGGTLVMTRGAAPRLPAPRASLLRRLANALFRLLYRVRHGSAPALPSRQGEPDAVQLTFTLRMEAGGPTAPLVNAILGPVMLPAAEALARKIVVYLEKSHESKRA